MKITLRSCIEDCNGTDGAAFKLATRSTVEVVADRLKNGRMGIRGGGHIERR